MARNIQSRGDRVRAIPKVWGLRETTGSWGGWLGFERWWIQFRPLHGDQLEMQHQIQGRPELDPGFAGPMQRGDGQSWKNRRGKKTKEWRTLGSSCNEGWGDELSQQRRQTQTSKQPLGSKKLEEKAEVGIFGSWVRMDREGGRGGNIVGGGLGDWVRWNGRVFW